MKKQPLFNKLIMTNLIIVFILAVGVSVIYYYYGEKSLYLEITTQNDSKFKQMARNIDIQLEMAVNLINSLNEKTSIKNFATGNSINQYSILNIYNDVVNEKVRYSITNMEYFIAIYNDGRDIAVSNQGTYYIKDYLSKFNINKDIIDNFKADNPNMPYCTVESTIDNGNNIKVDYLTLVKEHKTNSNDIIYFIITFNKSYMITGIDKEIERFIVARGKEEIASFAKSDLDKPLTSQVLGLVQEGIDNEKQAILPYWINSENSNVLDWTYIYSVSKNQYHKLLRNVVLISIFIWLCFMLLGIAIAFILFKRIYRPITDVVNILKPYTSSQNKDDFDFIKEIAVNISQSNKNLLSIVENNVLSMKEKFLKDYILGLKTENEISEAIVKYELNIFKSPLIVCVIEYTDHTESSNGWSKSSILRIQSEVCDLICEKLSEIGIKSERCELDYRRIVILIGIEDIDTVRDFFNDILEKVKNGFGFQFVSVIGRCVYEMKELGNSFNEAIMILDSYTYSNVNIIIAQEFLKEQNDDIYYYPLEIEKDIISYIIRNKDNEFMQLIQRVMEENFNNRDLGGQAKLFLILEIVGTVNRIMQITKKRHEDFFDADFNPYLELRSCNDNTALAKKITSIFETIIAKINNKQEYSKKISDGILRYIHKNYMRDISLTDVADEFNLSYSYLSRFFKSSTGQNFKDYLNNYKVDVAKNVLNQNHNKAIHELSEELGFNNVNTFIRIFSKNTGMTPGRYVTYISSDVENSTNLTE